MFEKRIFAENIHTFRKNAGFSQHELAQRLYVTTQSVSKWERGDAMPDVAKLCTLAEILKVSVDELLGFSHANKKQYMVAIDGGGTKTEFVLLDMQGTVCRRVRKDGCNPNITGLAEACAVLRDGMAALFVPEKQIAGIFAGISGCGAEKNKNAVTAFLQKAYPNAAVRCDTDVLNVLGCEPRAENCVLAICGTGSVVYAHEKGSLHRLGGWGYLLDADGSGFGIGKDALCATLAWEEGIGPKTKISGLVEEKLGSPVWDKIDDVYSRGQEFVASFAPCVFQAFHIGDEAAETIVQKHFTKMTVLINAALKKHPCTDTVLIAGGLLEEQGIIVNILKDNLPENVQILVPRHKQIFGACIQCCRLCGVDTALLEKTFEKDYKKAGEKDYA